MTVKPARAELLAFAAASRGDDWARLLEGAITEATYAGWPPLAIEAYILRFLLRDDSDPRELQAAVRAARDQDPGRYGPPPTPETTERGAGLARQMLTEALASAKQAITAAGDGAA